MIVVTDTTPLRYLVFIELVHILPRLFGTVYAPPEVVAELQRSRNPSLEPVRLWASSPPEWLVVREPITIDESLVQRLDRGESDAICLAQELKADKLLIDENAGGEWPRTWALKSLAPWLCWKRPQFVGSSLSTRP